MNGNKKWLDIGWLNNNTAFVQLGEMQYFTAGLSISLHFTFHLPVA
jgi:hypothetical protein